MISKLDDLPPISALVKITKSVKCACYGLSRLIGLVVKKPKFIGFMNIPMSRKSNHRSVLLLVIVVRIANCTYYDFHYFYQFTCQGTDR